MREIVIIEDESGLVGSLRIEKEESTIDGEKIMVYRTFVSRDEITDIGQGELICTRFRGIRVPKQFESLYQAYTAGITKLMDKTW